MLLRQLVSPRLLLYAPFVWLWLVFFASVAFGQETRPEDMDNPAARQVIMDLDRLRGDASDLVIMAEQVENSRCDQWGVCPLPTFRLCILSLCLSH